MTCTSGFGLEAHQFSLLDLPDTHAMAQVLAVPAIIKGMSTGAVVDTILTGTRTTMDTILTGTRAVVDTILTCTRAVDPVGSTGSSPTAMKR